MKTRTLVAARCGAALLALVPLAGCMSQHYAEQAPAAAATYYPLAVGDHWTYQYAPDPKHTRYDVDVTEMKAIEGVNSYAVAINQTYSYMAVLPSGIYQTAQGDPSKPTSAVVFQPAQRIYKLPFVVGDEWHTPVLLDPANPKSQIVSVYGRVENIEDVTVPAGRFKNCVQVTLDDPRDTPSDVTELWFAPNVGIVATQTAVQRNNKPSLISRTELVSYRLK